MVTIQCETAKGGSVVLNAQHHVWASYAVATVGDSPPSELLYVSATLKSGNIVQFFLNRETGLIVVDVAKKNGKSGTELIRRALQ